MTMRAVATVVIVGLGFSCTALAQTGSKPAPPSQSRGLTLSGCVTRSDTTVEQFTLYDARDKTTYRLSGSRLREYAGKRVEVVGSVVNSKKLQIAGGLRPSPNVAAQAGAIDPAGAAASAAGGPAPTAGPAPTLDFKVRSIRPADGGCGEP